MRFSTNYWLFLQCFFLGPFITLRSVADAVTASPFTFRHTQPDGTQTPELKIYGDETLYFITDEQGYAVVKDNSGWDVYAVTDINTGDLVPSQFIVGKVDPSTLPSLKPGLKPKRARFLMEGYNHNNSSDHFRSTQRRVDASTPKSAIVDAARAYQNGSLKHLVILIKFSDHNQDALPPRESYDVLFNQEGGDPLIAPTGSVRDIYEQSSYGKLIIDSTVLQWIKLPQTEAYYANGVSGLDFKLSEALAFALDEIDSKGLISFQDFDVDNNGVIDSITFIHSGFGAEWGGVDCYGASLENRIWSHQRADARKWCSSQNICMERYQIATGMWGRCSSEIGHIGVVGHEIGHFLGLNDMYDTDGGGKGIGSFGLMGNCWGFDQSQRHPPPLDAWSKMLLGWVQPTILSESGRYTIRAILDHPEIFIIKAGLPKGEYLMIENRQPKGFDNILPQGGLLVWHVDEKASYNTEGYPGQPGWPNNGNHYKVSLLQADGLYNMEKGENTGDAGDVWHGNGVYNIGPSESTESGPFPNTDCYQVGEIVKRTGIEIKEISISGDVMQFTLVLPNSPLSTFSAPLPTQKPQTQPPTRSPTTSPVTSTKSPQTISPTKSPITSSPTKSPMVKRPTNAPTTLTLTVRPTKLPQKSRRSSHPTKSPTKKPSSYLPTRPPSTKKRRPLPPSTLSPSATPLSDSTSDPTDQSHDQSGKLVFAELPVFRLEQIFTLSPEHHFDVKLLTSIITSYIKRVITQRYSNEFGPCTVNITLISSLTSNSTQPVTQARGRLTLSNDGVSTSVVEFMTVITFDGGSLPQLEEMTEVLIASFNGVQVSKGKGELSFAEFLKSSSNPVIATSEFVKVVVVPNFPQSTIQEGEESNRKKFMSTTWLFVLFAITPVVFASAVYYAVRIKGPRRCLQKKGMEKGKAEVEIVTAPSSPANVKAKPPLHCDVEADLSEDEEVCSEVYEGERPVTSFEHDGGSSILDCGTTWLSDLFNVSSIGGRRERPLPELNFLNFVESPTDGPKYT